MAIYLTAKRLNSYDRLEFFKGYKKRQNNNHNREIDEIFHRSDLVNLINSGVAVYASHKTPESQRMHQQVHVFITLDNQFHIRTDKNNTLKDNLYNLPDF